MSGTSDAHTSFHREHRSWFCPCAAPWIYEDKPWKASAWFEEETEDAPAEQDSAPQGALTWAS